jgi:hypothetical protein
VTTPTTGGKQKGAIAPFLIAFFAFLLFEIK